MDRGLHKDPEDIWADEPWEEPEDFWNVPTLKCSCGGKFFCFIWRKKPFASEESYVPACQLCWAEDKARFAKRRVPRYTAW
jgi:hypothetical protein